MKKQIKNLSDIMSINNVEQNSLFFKSDKIISRQLYLFNELEDIADNAEIVEEESISANKKEGNQREGDSSKFLTRIYAFKVQR